MDEEASAEHQGAPQDASGEASKPETMPAKQRASKGRVRWKEQIAGGRALLKSDVPTLGQIPLSEYLRAMRVKVTREQQQDVEQLRGEALRMLQELGVDSWSENSPSE